MPAPPPLDLPAWCKPYIGAPYTDDGRAPGTFNCWTLYAQVVRAEFGVPIVDYDGPVWAGRSGVEAMARAAEAFAAQFTEIDETETRAGDAILLRSAGAPIHIGCVVRPGWMLHCNPGIDVTIQSWRDLRYLNRIIGFYRP